MVVERIGDGEKFPKDSPVRLEYTGPFALELTLNGEFVQKLLAMVSTPTRPFIVRDGFARGRDFSIDLVGNGYSQRENEVGRSEIRVGDGEYAVMINSNVIGAEFANASIEYHRQRFKGILTETISGHLRKWADWEVRHYTKDLGWWDKRVIMHRHGALWNKYKGEIVRFESPKQPLVEPAS